MRPIRRNASPIPIDYSDYASAKAELASRLGPYCSFCERKLVTQLAVEHVQPKGLPAYRHLKGRWDNFLLACVNCNSTKKDKNVVLSQALLPDRDNTFAAFEYLPDGTVIVSQQARIAGLEPIAGASLNLTGLDKAALNSPDSNGKQVALDRVRQRMEVWLKAESAKADIKANPQLDLVRKYVVKLALDTGFFSVWLTVFSDDADMCLRLIRAFPGTEASGCFDSVTSGIVSPAPNPDGLPHGGKL